MIHIIDPEISEPLPSFALGNRVKALPIRYITDAQLYSARLVATKGKDGKYTINKWSLSLGLPETPVSEKELVRLIVLHV